MSAEAKKKSVIINICKDFTTTPGARLREDGPHSGEEFREMFLEPHFSSEKENYKIEIILDGTEGYPTSFLEEAFGGLARKYSPERCIKRLIFISSANEILIDEIMGYIKNGNTK